MHQMKQAIFSIKREIVQSFSEKVDISVSGSTANTAFDMILCNNTAIILRPVACFCPS